MVDMGQERTDTEQQQDKGDLFLSWGFAFHFSKGESHRSEMPEIIGRAVCRAIQGHHRAPESFRMVQHGFRAETGSTGP